jgi:predicted enzyme related to lactoylglutathione lyase
VAKDLHGRARDRIQAGAIIQAPNPFGTQSGVLVLAAFDQMSNIARLTISVAKLDVARLLYESMLGLEAKYEMPGMAMLVTSDGIELQLHERPPTPGDAGVAISFGVDDVDAMTVAAVAAGASIIKEPADQPWGERQSVLRDVDGHVFCLVAPLGTA